MIHHSRAAQPLRPRTCPGMRELVRVRALGWPLRYAAWCSREPCTMPSHRSIVGIFFGLVELHAMVPLSSHKSLESRRFPGAFAAEPFSPPFHLHYRRSKMNKVSVRGWGRHGGLTAKAA